MKGPHCELCERGFPVSDEGNHLPVQRLGMIPVTPCKRWLTRDDLLTVIYEVSRYVQVPITKSWANHLTYCSECGERGKDTFSIEHLPECEWVRVRSELEHALELR